MSKRVATAVTGAIPKRLRPLVDYCYLQARFFWTALGERSAGPVSNLPVPPPKLRYRVHGGLDRESFLAVGERCHADIQSALAAVDRRLQDFQAILDWGCGCGRVARHLLASGLDASISGCDIDEELAAWCRANLPGGDFQAVPHMPPTPYRDEQFDLVYGISVLTHLDEKMQHLWLAELRRILRPGGIALLTVHGARPRRNLAEEKRRILERDGIYFDVYQTGRFKHDGLPDFYQSTYHTREYVLKIWSRHLDILAYLENGMNRHHDVVVLRRAAPASA